MRNKLISLLILVSVIAIAACTPAPTAEPPTAVPPTVAPSDTPAPTNTPVPPTPTAAPTNTKVPPTEAVVETLAPPKDSTPVPQTDDWNKLAEQTANLFGVVDYAYEVYELSPASTYDDILKYYDDMMKDAGWAGQGDSQAIAGGKAAYFVNAENKSAFILIFLDKTADTPPMSIAILGKTKE